MLNKSLRVSLNHALEDRIFQDHLRSVNHPKDIIKILDNAGIYCNERDVRQLCAYIKIQLSKKIYH